MYYRDHLHQALDEHGDVAPPWEALPEYGLSSTGWRMGAGESCLGYFFAFLRQLPDQREIRLNYLRRHALAPHSWAGWVARIWDWKGLVLASYELESGESLEDLAAEDDWDTVPDEAYAAVSSFGLLGEDVAYKTWRGKRSRMEWPWAGGRELSQVLPTLHREYWFWSRWAAELRENGQLQLTTTVPTSWQKVRKVLLSGERPQLDLRQGNEALAVALCAGDPPGPWEFGLTHCDAAAYHVSTCYASAYTRWVQSCFDDRPSLERHLSSSNPPPAWRAWLAEVTRTLPPAQPSALQT